VVEYRSRSWVRDAFMEEAERVGGGTSREEVAFAVVPLVMANRGLLGFDRDLLGFDEEVEEVG